MDSPDYWRFVAALVFVLGLILAVAWVVRRAGLAGVRRPAASGRGRRLAIVDTQVLDARRRLVLVRRDGVEHLLLLGAQGETVVESAIAPGERAASFQASLAEAAGAEDAP
ncbi:MAG: flagellar biosynthetic protein FliO [Rhodospirillaceae bacterium]|nr:flagellar biosynthetic protein FliO [Rhodospirillaceae bacterium]